MQEIPTEAPLIIRWREHLPNMVNCYYAVDRVEVKLTNVDELIDSGTIVLMTTGRYHTVKYDEMPEFLRHWLPIKQEGERYYNHIYAELGIVAPASLNPITIEEQMHAMYLNTMKDLLADMESIRRNLKDTTINIKDPKSGVAGQNFLNQANQIANLNDKRIKNNSAQLQAFAILQKMIDSKDKDKGKKDG